MSDEQAYAKLQQISADIRSGKTTFADQHKQPKVNPNSFVLMR